MTRTPVIVAAVAVLVSCVDAAAMMLKMKENGALSIPILGEVFTVNALETVAENNFDVKDDSENFTPVVNVTDVNDDVDEDEGVGLESTEDTLSAVWYLAAFGGLVLFFFVVTCSELFLENPIYTRRQMDMPHAGFLRDQVWGLRNPAQSGGPGTPPPPYHLFAPPSYDECKDAKPAKNVFVPAADRKEKITDVYIVPVHHGPGTYPVMAMSYPNATSAAAAAAASNLEQNLKAQLDGVLPNTKFT